MGCASDIEFKEKPYEKYFGHELARLTNNRVTYSPDQHDEFILGFDEAFLIPKLLYLKLMPYRRRSRDSRLSGINGGLLKEYFKRLSTSLPPFKFNLFVQYKRPNYLKSRGAGQWSDWKEPYYRYSITQHQQHALQELENVSSGRASVIYASPAFWKSDDLWNHVSNDSIIDNSNIAAAGKLKGHKHYTYIKAGHKGKAHSKTVNIKSEMLSTIIKLGVENNDPLPLNQHLKKTAKIIIASVQESKVARSIFNRLAETMDLNEVKEDSIEHALAIIEVFSDIYDVRLYAFGE